MQYNRQSCKLFFRTISRTAIVALTMSILTVTALAQTTAPSSARQAAQSQALASRAHSPDDLTCFSEQQGNFKVIHDFTQQDAPYPMGVTIDQAGNLYGTTNHGGYNGTVFKLAQHRSNWVLSPLYSFGGGSYGNSSSAVIKGPDGLYGESDGGIRNCGMGQGYYCGKVFRLEPSRNGCGVLPCNFAEDVLYESIGGTDAWVGYMPISSPPLAFDRDDNLYGTSLYGGGGSCNDGWGCGAVYKLTPSGGSWTESILYRFTGGSDGVSPTQVLVGNDGNLYGIAGSPAYTYGLIFRLAPSASGWTETVLHTFQDSSSDGAGPGNLVQDSAGNLYGTAHFDNFQGGNFEIDGVVFKLSPSTDDNWTLTVLALDQVGYDYSEKFMNLAIDAAGNLYGTNNVEYIGCRGDDCSSQTSPDYDFFLYIFKLDPAGGGIQPIVSFLNQDFASWGPLAVDANGNLYGTTVSCGRYGLGTAWEVTP